MIKDLKIQALKDFKLLQKKVYDFPGSLYELCKELLGFNLDGEVFDCNFGTIQATVVIVNDGLFVQENFAIWNDAKDYVEDEYATYLDLVDYIKDKRGDKYNEIINRACWEGLRVGNKEKDLLYLIAADVLFEMRLDEWLEADRFDFIHDYSGIMKNAVSVYDFGDFVPLFSATITQSNV